MIHNILYKYLLIIIMSLGMLASHAKETTEITSLQQIKNASMIFLKQKISSLGLNEATIRIGDIDSRLNLAICQQNIEVTDNKNSRLPGNISLLVSCNQASKPWKIYIQASVNAYKNIIVAKSPIIRGQLIRNSDLVLQRRDITNLNGNYLTETRLVAGMVARQSIQQGQILKPYLLSRSRIIRRGDHVTILAETGSISVQMRGKALNDAFNGGRVRVLNTRSKRIVEGIAIRPGTVQVKM